MQRRARSRGPPVADPPLHLRPCAGSPRPGERVPPSGRSPALAHRVVDLRRWSSERGHRCLGSHRGCAPASTVREPPAAVEADPRRRGTRHLIHHRRSWRWLRQRTARPRQPRPHVRLALDPRDPAGLASRRLRTRRRSQSPASRRRRPRPSTGSRRGDRASRPSSRPNLGSRLGLDAERRLTRPSLTDLRR